MELGSEPIYEVGSERQVGEVESSGVKEVYFCFVSSSIVLFEMLHGWLSFHCSCMCSELWLEERTK